VDPVREKVMMLLQKRQFLFRKHDPAIKFGAGEKPAITGEDVEPEKHHHRGQQH
jgi:hypothetical protein